MLTGDKEMLGMFGRWRIWEEGFGIYWFVWHVTRSVEICAV